MGPMMGWNGGGWGWGFGFISMFLFWALLIVAVVALIRWTTSASGHGWAAGGGDRALELLRERYARGEIGREEFEAKKQDLR